MIFISTSKINNEKLVDRFEKVVLKIEYNESLDDQATDLDILYDEKLQLRNEILCRLEAYRPT